MDYSRGSEWRRWDLHIHTPDTLKNDQFKVSQGEDKWEKFYKTILNYNSNAQKSVCVIGITDYFSIENYKKVVENVDFSKQIPLILPNVELRLMPSSKSGALNLHCIFNPCLTPDDIEERFLAKLEFTYNETPYNATPRSLIQLGRNLSNDESIDEMSAKNKAISQFVVDISTLRNIFAKDKKLRENSIIILPNGGRDGASGIGCSSGQQRDSSFATVQNELYKLSDAIFSSKQKDIDYFLGKGPDSPQKVIDRCGKLMPCLHGSDAHDYDSIFEPDGKRYCWIKADCTFEGLRQIIYEPEARVRISELKPEEKKPYYVIDKIVINDPEFINTPIFFNENLTCIIGGKSTGKSVLLNNIANTIDSVQVASKLSIANDERILSASYPSPKLVVKWRDGTESTKMDVHNRKIVYIPQTYLNRLADITTEKNDIDNIIEGVLLQDESIKSGYDLMNKKITENKAIIDKTIYDLISVKNQIDELRNKILELGNFNAIENEIIKLTTRKNQLAGELSVSQEDLQSYENAVKQNREIDNRLKEIADVNTYLANTEYLLEKKGIDSFLTEQYRNSIIKEQNQEFNSAKAQWDSYREKKSKELLDSVETLKKEYAINLSIIDSVKKKQTEAETLFAINKEIEEEEKKKSAVVLANNQIKTLEEQYHNLLNNLLETYKRFESIYDNYTSNINSRTGLDTSDNDPLRFNARSVFRGDFFVNEFKKVFDSSRKKLKDILIFNDNPSLYNDYDDGVRSKLVDAVLHSNESPIIRKATTLESALRTIFSDYFTVNYSVTVDNDTIQEMSPGKKAIILLKLLISLAESNCPILIDQPEDDLDNRSIYNDLASFIREKKSKRQIIIVTHNANIVLGCDAEEVIVANQKGVNSPNNQFRFEYRSGSIENNIPILDENGRQISGVLNSKGIQQHICEILEGGQEAFVKRQQKYSLNT